MINTWSWIIWLASVLIMLWSTRSPVYLGLIFFNLIIVWRLVKIGIEKENLEESQQIPISPLKISLFIILFSAVFNGLISQFGKTVLFTLPSWLPYLGGPFTLEGLVFGALNGLVLSGILIAFFVINLALPVHSLIRLIPRAFYPIAVVASIAITFMPNTIRQFSQIREAQAIRGHRVRGLRDWLPLIMPLLVGGLEKALGLAEAMTARGFASGESTSAGKKLRISQAIGLAFIFSGWLMELFSYRETAGKVILLSGLGLVMFSFWKIGRNTPRSFYKQEKWSGYDLIVIALSTLIAVIYWLPSLRIDRSSLFYNPYPILTAPGINPFIIIITFSLLSPGIIFYLLATADTQGEKPLRENDHI